jgi:TctA family transporter
MLGFILGPMMEENFRRALLISRGSFSIFVNRPISGTLLGLLAVFVGWQLISFVTQQRRAKKAGTKVVDEGSPIAHALAHDMPE